MGRSVDMDETMTSTTFTEVLCYGTAVVVEPVGEGG
jgi:uncharacterized protein YbjQ (UPF0145 family)